MGLLRRNMTPSLLAANQSNSKKSTGPSTELGKRHTGRNAGKHLVFARVTPPYMKELGEDPADFEKLRESLRQAFEPQDGFEEMLVEDMTVLRWRRQRLLRAEAGILTSRRRNFVVKRKLEAVNEQKAHAAAETPQGLADRSGSHPNSVAIMQALTTLKESIERMGFRKDDRFWLASVYGSEDSSQAGYLFTWFDECCSHPESNRSDEQEEVRQDFLGDLELKIAWYKKLIDLYRERDIEIPQPRIDAQLLPEQETLDKILRYEAALERQFERKVQLLVAWRKEKGDALVPSSEDANAVGNQIEGRESVSEEKPEQPLDGLEDPPVGEHQPVGEDFLPWEEVESLEHRADSTTDRLPSKSESEI
jgi:hypothetical protein